MKLGRILKPLINRFARSLLKRKAAQRALSIILSDSSYAALVLRLAEVKGNRYAEKTVLCFVRGLFDKDIEELQYRLRDYKWLCVRTSVIARPQMKHVPQQYRRQRLYSNYLDDTAAWSKCIDFASTFFEVIAQEYKVVACMDANIDYWQTYAFQKAAEAQALPFLVLSKENPVTTDTIDMYKDFYKGFRFHGTAVACPSATLSKTFREIGVVDEAHLWVTGYPRLDRYRTIDFMVPASANIVLLSFLKGYGLRSPAEYDSVLEALRAATNSSDATQIENIIIKTKNAPDRVAHEKIDSLSQWRKQDPRVMLTDDADLYDCFASAKVVIGANSQALVEALLTKAPVIVPQWSIIDEPSLNFFKESDGSDEVGLYISRTPDEFGAHIEECLQRRPAAQESPARRRARLELVNRYVTFDDNRSASCAVAEMIECYHSD